MSDEWHPTACILCSVNCGLEVRIDGPTITRVRGDKAHPGFAGLHVREGSARRPLPERSAAPDHAAAPPPRRHVRGDRLGHRDRRGRGSASTTSIAEHGGDKILFYGGGGQGNHLGGGYGGVDAVGARHPLHLERPRPGEDRRVLGRRPAVRPLALPHRPATTSTPRSPCSGARTRGSRTASRRPAGSSRRSPTTRARTLIVVDPRRTESADLADIHLRPRPGGDADLLAALLAVLVEERLLADALAGRARQRARRGGRPPAHDRHRRSVRPGRRRRSRRAPRRARDRHGHRWRVDLRGPRHPDGAALDAQQLPREADRAAHRQLRRSGRHEPALALRSLCSAAVAPAAGDAEPSRPSPAPAGDRARAVQRDPRRDPRPTIPTASGRCSSSPATPPTRWPTATACARRCAPSTSSS